MHLSINETNGIKNPITNYEKEKFKKVVNEKNDTQNRVVFKYVQILGKIIPKNSSAGCSMLDNSRNKKLCIEGNLSMIDEKSSFERSRGSDDHRGKLRKFRRQFSIYLFQIKK